MPNIFVDSSKRTETVRMITGLIVSLITSLTLILGFAFVIKSFELSDSVITPVNIGIKIISIGAGVLIATKSGKKGLTKGILLGILYVVCSFVIYSILLKAFKLDIKFLLDLILGIVSGAILGIICVNIRK